MKTINFKLVFSAVSVVTILLFAGCEKENPPPVCDAKGSYSGTFTNQFGQSGVHAYSLRENNFVVGAATLEGISNPNTAGSYTNTCDSLIMTTWNSINNSYYSFKGKFSNNRTIVNGVYKNLTTPSETGPFKLTKQ
jgi:hypothetical protein